MDRIAKPRARRCGAEGHRSGLVIIVAKLVQELDEVRMPVRDPDVPCTGAHEAQAAFRKDFSPLALALREMARACSVFRK